jgi:rhodanese-related sulfurtransferase
MKRLLSVFLLVLLLVQPAAAYDREKAQALAQFLAPFAEGAVPKALGLVPPEKLLTELKEGKEIVFLDVRTPKEFGLLGITHPGTLNIPMNELFRDENLARLPADKTILVLCHTGLRAGIVAVGLRQIGFENVRVLKGGIVALAGLLDPKSAYEPLPPPAEVKK